MTPSVMNLHRIRRNRVSIVATSFLHCTCSLNTTWCVLLHGLWRQQTGMEAICTCWVKDWGIFPYLLSLEPLYHLIQVQHQVHSLTFGCLKLGEMCFIDLRNFCSQVHSYTAMLFSPFGCTNPPPSVLSFLLVQNQSPKDFAGSDITNTYML